MTYYMVLGDCSYIKKGNVLTREGNNLYLNGNYVTTCTTTFFHYYCVKIETEF